VSATPPSCPRCGATALRFEVRAPGTPGGLSWRVCSTCGHEWRGDPLTGVVEIPFDVSDWGEGDAVAIPHDTVAASPEIEPHPCPHCGSTSVFISERDWWPTPEQETPPAGSFGTWITCAACEREWRDNEPPNAEAVRKSKGGGDA
jgi:hypothetical protein